MWAIHIQHDSSESIKSSAMYRKSVRFTSHSSCIVSSFRPRLLTMFCKSTLLALALTLVASASPMAHEGHHDATPGVSIPVHKRNTLTNADGTFNHERAVREIVKTKK